MYMKKTFVLLLMGLGLTGSVAFGQKRNGEERQQELYRQAMDLYGKQKYAAAQQIYDEIALGDARGMDLTRADACYFADEG